jgi:hypothetical protein
MKYINYEVPETACPEGLDTPEEKWWAKPMTLLDEESNYLHMKHRTVIITNTMEQSPSWEAKMS